MNTISDTFLKPAFGLLWTIVTVFFRVLGKVIAAWWAFRTASDPLPDEERERQLRDKDDEFLKRFEQEQERRNNPMYWNELENNHHSHYIAVIEQEKS